MVLCFGPFGMSYPVPVSLELCGCLNPNSDLKTNDCSNLRGKPNIPKRSWHDISVAFSTSFWTSHGAGNLRLRFYCSFVS